MAIANGKDQFAVWDLEAQKNLWTLGEPVSERSSSIHVQSNQLAVAGRSVFLVDLSTGARFSFFPKPFSATCVAFSPDGKKCALASTGGVWLSSSSKTATGWTQPLWKIRSGNVEAIWWLSRGFLGLEIVEGSGAGIGRTRTISVRDPDDPKKGELLSVPIGDEIRRGTAWDPKGERVAVVDGQHEQRPWGNNGSGVGIWSIPAKPPNGPSASPPRQTPGSAKPARPGARPRASDPDLYDSTMAEGGPIPPQLTIPTDGHAPRVVTWSPTGDCLATGDDRGRTILWDTQSGKQLGVFLGSGLIEDLAWSPSGDRLATLDSLGQMKVWDTSRFVPRAP